MRVIYIITGLGTGGAEAMLLKLLERLDREHYTPMVISLTTTGEIGERIAALEIPAYILRMEPNTPNLTKFICLIRLLYQLRPDVVHTWMYHADLLGGLAAKWVGCSKIIWGVRNTDLLPGNGVSKSTALIMRLSALLSNIVPYTIICVAESAKRTHAEMGYAQNKMRVISNGFDVETYKADAHARHRIRQMLNLPSNALVIGSIGRFNEYKDHRNFILAAGDVASADETVYFLMVGRDVDCDNALIRKWIHETGYSDRFILLGERSDVMDILKAMDVFCLHSISEGFPNVLGEAMSTSLPCVVTDVGDAARLLGNTGLVVPPRNPSALAEELLKLVKTTPEQRINLGCLARKRIVEHWSIDQVTQQYEQLYQEVFCS